MNLIKEVFDAVLRVFFGHNLVDNTKDWKSAHDKSKASRAEVDKIIQEAEKSSD